MSRLSDTKDLYNFQHGTDQRIRPRLKSIPISTLGSPRAPFRSAFRKSGIAGLCDERVVRGRRGGKREGNSACRRAASAPLARPNTPKYTFPLLSLRSFHRPLARRTLRLRKKNVALLRVVISQTGTPRRLERG